MSMDQKRLLALQELERFLGLSFSKKENLNQALIHSSYAHQRKIPSNERLEFLGDSVLELIVSRHLFDNCLTCDEGSLTKIRSSLVNQKVLCRLAKQFHLVEYLLVSKSMKQSRAAHNPAVLADTFEAVVGAVYLELDYHKTTEWLWPLLQPFLDRIEKESLDEDYKSRLQVYMQRKYKGLPVYKLVSVEGPEHDQTMYVEVFLQSVLKGDGCGRSKKEAEQQAAKCALSKLESEIKNG